MTATKNVYALMLALVIVLSGCFGNAANDTDAQDSGTEENSGQETDSTSSESQERIWYTSGGTYNLYWNMEGVSSNGDYCTEWNNQFDPDTGEPVNGTCAGSYEISTFSEWNVSECTDAGGVATPHYQAATNPYYHRYAPSCTIEFATINTSSGEALLVYQYDSLSMETTCNGVTDSSGLVSSKEYTIVSGSAMDCSHRIYKPIGYDNQNYQDPDNPQNGDMGIWSIVYAIQDVTVV
jgi:hypothetical protein